MMPPAIRAYLDSRREDRRKLCPRYDVKRGDGVMFRKGCTGEGARKLLALSAGIHTGFALFDMQTKSLDQCWYLWLQKPAFSFEREFMRGEQDHPMAYQIFRDTVDIVAKENNISFVAQARPYMIEMMRALFPWGFYGVQSLWCKDRDVTHSWHLWTTIKQWACNDEYANEDMVIAESLRRWPTMSIGKHAVAMACLTGAYALEVTNHLRGKALPLVSRGKPFFVAFDDAE